MYRGTKTAIVSDRQLLVYTIVVAIGLFVLSFFDKPFIPDPENQTLFFAAINSIIPQTGLVARILAITVNILVAVAVYFINEKYYFIRRRSLFPVFCIVLLGGMFPYALSADSYCQILILIAIVRFLDSYNKNNTVWHSFQIMLCVSSASLISPSYIWYILIFYAGFIIYNKFSWLDFFASLFGILFPLLIAVQVMFLLDKQELMLGAAERFLKIPQFEFVSVLHVLPQVLILLMSLISFTEFIIHYSEAKTQQRKSMSFLFMFLAMVCGMFYFYPSSLQIQGNTYAMLSGICIAHFFATNNAKATAVTFYAFTILLLVFRVLDVLL